MRWTVCFHTGFMLLIVIHSDRNYIEFQKHDR